MTRPPDSLVQALAGRYEVERPIGSGGMATVYLARDLRHGRPVAIKVLRPDVASSLGPDRFTREIEIAARLTHPHILPLHDSGAAGELLYYVMPYVESDSLLDRLARDGPLAVPDAARIFREIIDALSAAHARGVVHRDIKPGNILLADGHALVADFGVARAVSEATAAHKQTTVGVALGTPQYMAPEQASADPATDHRADLFAAGVVAYEMLTGTSPFAAGSAAGVFAALVNRIPEHPCRVRDGVPERLGDVVMWCLEKDPDARPQTASELRDRWDEALAGTAGAGATARRSRRRFTVVAGVVVALAAFGGWRAVDRAREVRWARGVALPEVLRLADANQPGEAAALALRVEAILGADPVLEPLWPRITTPIRVTTRPEGATVSYRPYASTDTTWIALGTTPYAASRFPVGAYRFQVELAGHETRQVARSLIPAEMLEVLRSGQTDYTEDPSYALDLELTPAAEQPADMIHVGGGLFLTVPVTGFATIDPIHIPEYWIDRVEVTNAAYRAFVEAGAYADSTLWTESFRRDGAVVPWRRAVSELVDATGRPGPSTWVLGRPPDGQESFPVGGVSWYEASAYCAWRDKSLPTLFHWARAAVPSTDSWFPFHPILGAASNFGSDGPVPVGTLDAIGTAGAQDLAGNVREWVSTASGEARHFAGGAWNDPAYAARDRVVASPWVRLPTDGFRCARYPEGALTAELLRDHEPPQQDLTDFEPMSDALFDATRPLYTYDRSQPLAARLDSTLVSARGETVEWVSVNTAYGGRLPIRLHLPSEGRPPYGAVIFFPGSDLIFARQTPATPVLPFLPRVGWVFVEPVYDGGFARNDGRTAQRLQSPASRQELLSHWSQDIGRTIDYLEQRPDVDGAAVAYAGLSLGASLAPRLLPYEARFRGAVLLSGGFSPEAAQASIDDLAALAGRARTPLLMLGGRSDFSNPIAHQEALFRAFGTPDEHKRLRAYDAAHWPLPMNEVIRETMDFLERYVVSGGDGERGR